MIGGLSWIWYSYVAKIELFRVSGFEKREILLCFVVGTEIVILMQNWPVQLISFKVW